MTPRREERHGASGFTLLELMIVITIISVLAVIAFPRLIEARKHAEERSAINTVRVIFTAQLQFKEKYGLFAPSLNILVASGLVDKAFKSVNPFGGGLLRRGTWEFTTRVPTPESAAPPIADSMANRKTRFRIGAQPAGDSLAEKRINGDHLYFMLETGRLYQSAGLSIGLNCDSVAQTAADPMFGSGFLPVVSGL